MGSGLIEPIVKGVAKKYGIPAEALLKAHSNTAREARHLVCWLASKLTRLSPNEIAAAIGKHGNAARHGIRYIDSRRGTDAWLSAAADQLLEALKAELAA